MMDEAMRMSETMNMDSEVCPFIHLYPQCKNTSCSTHQYAREIETLLTIQQAITSQLNLNLVLQMIADEAQNLTAARLSFVYVLEGNELVLAAVTGYENADSLIGYRIQVDKSLAGQSIQTRQPIILCNVQDNDIRVYDEAIKPFGNISCYLTVPLIYGSSSIGVIAVADQCKTVFSGDSLRVLSMLAPSAVIGIENARLYQEQQERRLEAESRHQMAESLRVMLAIVNSNRSLNEVLDYIVKQVSSRLMDCQATAIFARKTQDEILTVQAACGLPYELVESQYLPGYDAANRAIQSRQPVIISNTQAGGADDEANLVTGPVEWAVASQAMAAYQALMAVPLIIKGDIYGVILMYYLDPHDFSPEEINLALMFSDQVALAIENASLRFQAEEAAVNAERNRLARELHDAVSQTLFSANLIAEVLPLLWDQDQDEARERLLELNQLTRGAQAEMRTLLFELRPAVFREVGLSQLLKHLTRAISVRSQIPICLVVNGEQKLGPEVQIALYRITQEALNNVVKHAGSKQTSVNLIIRPEKVELSVVDDGCGFAPSTVTSDHFGLSIMKERADSIHAALQISSRIGHGTQVKVIWENPSTQEEQV